MSVAAPPVPPELSERGQVILHRYREARLAKMTPAEARIFAHDHGIDVGQLRHLIKLGCPADRLAAILL